MSYHELKLSEKLEGFRCERPSEWMMDEYMRDAVKLENRINALEAVAEAAHKFISPLNNRHSFTEFHDLEQTLQAAGYGDVGR